MPSALTLPIIEVLEEVIHQGEVAACLRVRQN